MTAAEWKKRIKKDCKAVGTYKPQFDEVIETLSQILEKRDDAESAFQKTGGKVIVKHTNKAGAENLEQNPALRLINDLNRDALTYWRDLGLTPKGLKAINESAVKQNVPKRTALTEALERLGTK